MRKLIITLVMLFGSSVWAGDVCSSVFQTIPTHDSSFKFQTQTHDGKPRYYSVRNYNRLVDSELATFLKSFKNLTQLSEKIEQLNTFIPERDQTIPSEAFFAANEIVPLIESFLRVHEVNYRVETIYKSHEEKIKRTLIVITTNGHNSLNKLANELNNGQEMTLTIDPMELFYGYNHYNESQGKVFDIDEYRPAYALSFHLVMHSQRKDFIPEFSKDAELKQALEEIEIERSLKIQKAAPVEPPSYRSYKNN